MRIYFIGKGVNNVFGPPFL